MLDYVALAVIFFIVVLITILIVFIGSTPGKIARRRGHPWPDAVNAASWIGLATGVLWPIAFVWAFLPLPRAKQNANDSGDADLAVSQAASTDETETLQQRIAALETTIQQLQSRQQEGVK